jgi:hypothetical protein
LLFLIARSSTAAPGTLRNRSFHVSTPPLIAAPRRVYRFTAQRNKCKTSKAYNPATTSSAMMLTPVPKLPGATGANPVPKP